MDASINFNDFNVNPADKRAAAAAAAHGMAWPNNFNLNTIQHDDTS